MLLFSAKKPHLKAIQPLLRGVFTFKYHDGMSNLENITDIASISVMFCLWRVAIVYHYPTSKTITGTYVTVH